MQGFDEIYSDSKYESEELYSVVATGRQSYDVPTSSDFCEPIVSRDYSWCGVPGVVASRMAALGLQNPPSRFPHHWSLPLQTNTNHI
jgi:hypothetical protein